MKRSVTINILKASYCLLLLVKTVNGVLYEAENYHPKDRNYPLGNVSTSKKVPCTILKVFDKDQCDTSYIRNSEALRLDSNKDVKMRKLLQSKDTGSLSMKNNFPASRNSLPTLEFQNSTQCSRSFCDLCDLLDQCKSMKETKYERSKINYIKNQKVSDIYDHVISMIPSFAFIKKMRLDKSTFSQRGITSTENWMQWKLIPNQRTTSADNFSVDYMQHCIFCNSPDLKQKDGNLSQSLDVSIENVANRLSAEDKYVISNYSYIFGNEQERLYNLQPINFLDENVGIVESGDQSFLLDYDNIKNLRKNRGNKVPKCIICCPI